MCTHNVVHIYNEINYYSYTALIIDRNDRFVAPFINNNFAYILLQIGYLIFVIFIIF